MNQKRRNDLGDDRLPEVFSTELALEQLRSMPFEELRGLIVRDLVPDSKGRSAETLLAETVACDYWRLREVIAAQLLGEEGVSECGMIEIDIGDETFEQLEPEAASEPRVSTTEPSLSQRLCQGGPDARRPVLPPASLREEKTRLTKQLIDKLRAIRRSQRSRVLNRAR